MRTAWALVAVVVVAGCSSKKKDPTPLVVEEEMAPPTQPVVPPLPDDEQPEPAAVPDDPPDAPSNPECVDQATVVSWDPAKLRACFDSNGDDEPDRCVTWRRDGKVASIDTTFAVEDIDADAKEPVEPAIEFRSDTENNDDERITLDGSSIEVCPYEHACMRIMPKADEAEVHSVFTDPDYKRGAFLLRDYEGGKATLEIWDLVTGRMKTRTPMKRLLADEMYDFSMHMGSGAMLVLAADTNGRALGSVFSLDGSFRGEVGGGSRNLDIEKSFQHLGVFGIVDVGSIDADDEKPYVLYLHSLATGGALGKFSIPRAGTLSFDTLPNNFVAVTQWGEKLRIDMIDLRSRTNRVLFAPGC